MAEGPATVEYRMISGFPGYCVGDDGSVWSRIKQRPIGKGGGTVSYLSDSWRRLARTPTPGGYLSACVCRDGRKVTRKVHLFVMEAFVGLPPPGMEVCHRNGNGKDNRLENLRYDTHRENMADRERHGRTARAERNGSSKLTADQVRAIRGVLATGQSQRSVAAGFGVARFTVQKIASGRNWKSVPQEATA